MDIFPIQKSKFYLIFLGILHIAALGAILILTLSNIIKLILVLILVGYGLYHAAQYRSKSYSLAWSAPRQWFIILPSGEMRAVNIKPHSVVTRYLILLYSEPVVPERKKIISLLVCHDSLNQGDHKRLRAKLSL